MLVTAAVPNIRYQVLYVTVGTGMRVATSSGGASRWPTQPLCAVGAMASRVQKQPAPPRSVVFRLETPEVQIDEEAFAKLGRHLPNFITVGRRLWIALDATSSGQVRHTSVRSHSSPCAPLASLDASRVSHSSPDHRSSRRGLTRPAAG